MIICTCCTNVLAHNDLIKNISDFTRISKIRIFTLNVGNIQHLLNSIVCNRVFTFLKHKASNLLQLATIIVREIKLKLNSGNKTRVGRQHLHHLVLITGKNNTELSSVVLHCLNQSCNGFLTIIPCAAIFWNQCIRFINKQYTAHGTLNCMHGLLWCFTYILSYKTSAIHLDDFLCRQNLCIIKDARNNSGNFRLTCTRITIEAHMNIQSIAALICQGISLDFFDAFLDIGQANKTVQFFFAFTDIS